MKIVKNLLFFIFILFVIPYTVVPLVFDAMRPFKIPETQTSHNDFSLWKSKTNTVLNDLDAFWAHLSAKNGLRYEPPQRASFFGKTKSACNSARLIEGPAYCLDTKTIVMDEGLFQSLSRQLNTLGHLGVAYSIAHQYGHHIQNLQGKLNGDANKTISDRQKALIEKQADCFAGLWIKQAQKKYGTVPNHNIRWTLEKVRIWGSQNHKRKPLATILEEDFSQGDARDREQWFFRGYASGNFTRCSTKEIHNADKK